MKKVTCLVLALFMMLLAFNLSASATVLNNAEHDAIITSLRNIEDAKADFGLQNVNFESMCVSKPIHTYIYTNNGLEENYEYTPLLINNRLVALAIKLVGESGFAYQITTNLVEELSPHITSNNAIALIYDSDGCYIYNGELIQIFANASKNASRLSISDATSLSFDGLKRVKADTITSLNYSSTNNSSRAGSVILTCPVTYVPQTHTKTCWAASIACILNYKFGTSYTDTNIAQAYWGSTVQEVYNRGVSPAITENILSSYGLNYIVRDGPINLNYLADSLRNDYPVEAGFSIENSPDENDAHAVVIYSYHIMSSYIYVMDPEYGSQYVPAPAAGNFDYWYVSAFSGSLLVLNTYLHRWVGV